METNYKDDYEMECQKTEKLEREVSDLEEKVKDLTMAMDDIYSIARKSL